MPIFFENDLSGFYLFEEKTSLNPVALPQDKSVSSEADNGQMHFAVKVGRLQCIPLQRGDFMGCQLLFSLME